MEWTRSTFEPHPEGEFRAQFVAWEEDHGGNYGPQVKLSFDTEEKMDDGRPFRISVWAKPSLHEKGKVAKLLKALGIDAEEIEPEEFSLDDYVGRKCRVMIEHYRGQDGNTKARIVSFLAPKKGKSEPEPETSGDRAAQEKHEPAAVGAGKKAADPDWESDE